MLLMMTKYQIVNYTFKVTAKWQKHLGANELFINITDNENSILKCVWNKLP